MSASPAPKLKVFTVGPGSGRLYICGVCGEVFQWDDDAGCCWWGSYKDLEESPEKIVPICSKPCTVKHRREVEGARKKKARGKPD